MYKGKLIKYSSEKEGLKVAAQKLHDNYLTKGGKYYKFLPRAWDDNYSPSGYTGIKYPLDMLTKAKVPIMYASNAKQMAAKFLAGGDNPKAC